MILKLVNAPFEDLVPFEDLAADLLADGYLAAPPPWVAPWALEVDREVCQESVCDSCGATGLHFEAFHNPTTRSYVGTACCPACGLATEV